MFRSLPADKDAYITDKVIKGTRKTSANVGAAATLDLFKLYGMTTSGSTPNTELSRALIHFDLSQLRSLIAAGQVDVGSPSFWCKLRMRDVYGGQTTPTEFTVTVNPLSTSFYEGYGKDVVYFSNGDAACWLSSSRGVLWATPGCGNPTSDFIGSLSSSQYFRVGDEDLSVDVTTMVSSALAGAIPDAGFRVALSSSHETDTQTYFVKRFGSRTVYDERKRPSLEFGYDDSVVDDSQNMYFDVSCSISAYNYVGGVATNFYSGAPLTGSNCVAVRLETPVSGGVFSAVFSGSQVKTGIYTTSVTLPSAPVTTEIAHSGTLNFTPIWLAPDLVTALFTGSSLPVRLSDRGTSARSLQNLIVSVTNARESYYPDSDIVFNVNIFDQSSPMVTVVKVPSTIPGIVMKSVFYRIRDVATNAVIVPFDDVTNSTKVSSDATSMFFVASTSPLTHGRTYEIDIMIKSFSESRVFLSASPPFRVEDSPTS